MVLANKLFDRRVALVSGLLLATSPFFVKWSQQARAYSMFVALCLIAMLLLLRAFERNSRGAWAVFGLALSAVIVWHPVSGFLVLPAYAVFIVQRRERFLPHGLLSAVIVAILAVPWAATTAMRSRVQMGWIEFPTPAVAARAVLDVSGAAGLGLLLACVGFWVLRRTGRSDLAVWLGAWAACPFVLALLVSFFQPMFLDRFLIAMAPAFAMLAAVAVDGRASAAALGRRRCRRARHGDRPCSVVRAQGARQLARRGLAEATRTVLALKEPGDDVVVVPWWAYRGAEYYGARPNDTSTADSIWVLNWSEDGHELPADERAPLGFGDHVLVEERSFGWRLSAQLWKRPGTP